MQVFSSWRGPYQVCELNSSFLLLLLVLTITVFLLSFSISSEFYPEPEKLCKTEVMEYALSLSKPDFSLPSFQTYKLLLTLKLVEAGQLAKVMFMYIILCDY